MITTAPRRGPAPRPLVVLAYLAVSLIWGSTYLGIRIALEEFAPMQLGALRFVLAGGVLYVVLRLRGAAAPRPTEWAAAALTGGLFFAVGNGLVNVAEKGISSGLASVLVATMPLWATLFTRLFGGRIQPREWVGLALGLVGVVTLNLSGDLRGSGVSALCALLAPMGWALGSVAGKRLPLPEGAMATAAQMICGGALMAVLSVLLRERGLPEAPSVRALGAALYLAVFGSLAGFTAYNYLLQNTRTSVATSYAFVNPAIAVLLGVLFAGEALALASVVGAAIILAAVLLILRGREARSRSEAADLAVSPQGTAVSPTE
jgi:drug/metabolite transporter (DMT)-like permease